MALQITRCIAATSAKVKGVREQVHGAIVVFADGVCQLRGHGVVGNFDNIALVVVVVERLFVYSMVFFAPHETALFTVCWDWGKLSLRRTWAKYSKTLEAVHVWLVCQN